MPRILLLEDQAMIALLLEDWLMELSCVPVGPARSVAQALALIEAEALDGAILDVSLEGEDCYAAAERLRAKAIPFVFATGHGAAGIKPSFHGTPVLAKPFDFAAVQAVVTEFLKTAEP